MGPAIRSGIIGFLLLPAAFIVMGVFGALFPAYGPLAFLIGEITIGVYSLYRLALGIQGMRYSPVTERALRHAGFGVGSTLAFALVIVKVYFFPS
jgi:hypothetical protein